MYTEAQKKKAHEDDISTTLILNKKAVANHESQLFQSELDKFRPYQQRIIQAAHKQTALMKELTKSYGNLLQDKRVRSEQARYESFTRQRNSVLTKYKRVFQAFNDLIDGLVRAQTFYSDMRDTAESLEKNVDTFVSNRRSEGAQLLAQIERDKQSNNGNQADRERDRLKDLMERMSMSPGSTSPIKSHNKRPNVPSRPSQSGEVPAFRSPPLSPPYQPISSTYGNGNNPRPTASSYASPVSRDSQQLSGVGNPTEPYNPMTYSTRAPISPPPQDLSRYSHQSLPEGYIPPPPPPGPPPNTGNNYGHTGYHQTPAPPGVYQPPHHQPRQSGNLGPQSQNDPWAGLNAWK